MSRRPSASRSQITETVFVHVWKVRPGPNWANKQQFSHLFRLKSAHANNWSGRKGNKEWGVHGGLLTCSVLLSITSSLYTCLSFTSLDSCPVFVCTSCSCLYSYVCYQPDLTHSAKAQHYFTGFDEFLIIWQQFSESQLMRFPLSPSPVPKQW